MPRAGERRPRAVRRDEALRLLAEHRDELRAMGAAAFGLFGSVARDEAGLYSDVDILVEMSGRYDLFDLGGLQQRLEEIFDCPVDLVVRDWLRPELRDAVLAEEVCGEILEAERGAGG